MENASKALLMAGSILISLVIIGALIFMFRNITGYQKTAGTVTEEKQIAEFNKEYTSFEKNLYGSELLSLINKAVDYNTKNTADGYTPITITLEVKNGTGSNNASSLVKAGTYSINSKTSNVISSNLLVEIEDIKTKYGGDKYLQRLVSLNNSAKTAEIETLLKELNSTYTYASCRNDIVKYTEYMEFKRKKFKFKQTLFDGEQAGASTSTSNGRIVEMKYEEITN